MKKGFLSVATALLMILGATVLPTMLGTNNVQAQITFAAARQISMSGSSNDHLAKGDFNHDGRTDIVVASGGSLFNIFLQSSGGILSSTPISHSYCSAYHYGSGLISAGDMNNDGMDDIIMCYGDSVWIFRQDTSGFNTRIGLSISSGSPDLMKVADVDGDGKLDIIISRWGSSVVVLYQNTTGGFTETAYSAVYEAGYDDIKIGKVANDSLVSIIQMGGQTWAPIKQIRIHSNRSVDTIITYSLPITSNMSGVGIGDFYGTGYKEIAASYGGNRPASHVAVWRHVDTITTADTVLSVWDIPQPIETGRFDCSGRDQIAVSHGGWNSISVVDIVAGVQRFSAYIPNNTAKDGMVIADINGDGKNDIVTVNTYAGLTVLLNTTLFPGDVPYVHIHKSADSFCQSSSLYLTDSVASPHKPHLSYTWITTDGNQMIISSDSIHATIIHIGTPAGNHYMVLAVYDSISGITKTDTARYTVWAEPYIVSSSTTSWHARLGCGGSPVTISIVPSIPSTVAWYYWSGTSGYYLPDTGLNVIAHMVGTFSAMLTGTAHGCSAGYGFTIDSALVCDTVTHVYIHAFHDTVCEYEGIVVLIDSIRSIHSGHLSYSWVTDGPWIYSDSTHASTGFWGHPGFHFVALTVYDSINGTSATDTAYVTVWANPVITSITPNTSLGCSDSVNLSVATNVPTTVAWLWYTDTSYGFLSDSGYYVTAHFPAHFEPYPTEHVHGCTVWGDIINVTSLVITGSSEVCKGSKITLSDATSGGVWHSSNTSIASVGTTGIVTGNNTGTATISYTKSGCTTTKIITVNANPLLANTGVAVICVGNSTTLSNSTSGGLWSSSPNTIITFGDTTGIITGMSVGTIPITYTVSSGCFKATTVTVNNTYPATIGGAPTVCTGSNVTTLTDATTGGTWSSSNTAVANVSLGHVYGYTNGTAIISYTKLGCSATQIVTVNTNPLSANTGTNAVCVGSTTTLANSTSGGVWASSNTSFATVDGTSGVVSGIAVGLPIVTYSSGGCYKLTNMTVNNTYPSTISGTTNVCTGSNITQLTDATTGGTWTSSAPTIATVNSLGKVTGLTAGVTTISYTKIGCSAIQNVTVNTNPLAANIGLSAVCVGSTITLANSTTGGLWTSSNTSLATIGSSTGVVYGVAVGIPVTTYTLSSGCYKINPVTVNNTYPMSITGTPSVCSGSNVTTLTDSTTGGTWSSSNPAIANVSVGHVYGYSAGVATISYTKLGCSAVQIVTVNTNPLAANTGSSAVCLSSTITLSNTTSGGAWTSSNTSSATIGSSTGIVSGVAVGVSTITYMLGTGCYKTNSMTTKIPPTTIAGLHSICSSHPDTLTESVTGGSWTSSANTRATVTTTGIVTGHLSGTAIISYTISGCTPATFSVTVNSACREGGENNENYSITENATNVYSLYPNPSSGDIYITQSIVSDETVSVKVINSLGQTVYSNTLSFTGGSSEMNVNNLIPGLYLVVLNEETKLQTFRVVIEK